MRGVRGPGGGPAGPGPERAEAARNLEAVCDYLRDTRAVDAKGTLAPAAQRREDAAYRILAELFSTPSRVRPRRVLAGGWKVAQKHNDKHVKRMYGAARFIAEPHAKPKGDAEPDPAWGGEPPRGEKNRKQEDTK